MRIFALDASRGFGEGVTRALGVAPARHEERAFEDGEHKARPLESVRGRDVYIVQGLHGGPDLGPDAKLCRLLFFAAALRDAGADRVTAVIPYLAYARKDRRTQSRDPVTVRYVAQLIEAVGVDRVLAIDVHNPAAFENAFRIQVVHLEARFPLAARLAPALRGEKVVVVSPDTGGAKRAMAFADALAGSLQAEIGLAWIEKRRAGGVLSGAENVVGEVEGHAVVIVDDLVASGATLARAAAACRAQGARRVLAAVTHGLFTGEAVRRLEEAAFETLLVTDTVPPFRLPPEVARAHLGVVELAPGVAEAIRRLHENRSLEGLWAAPQPSGSA